MVEHTNCRCSIGGKNYSIENYSVSFTKDPFYYQDIERVKEGIKEAFEKMNYKIGEDKIGEDKMGELKIKKTDEMTLEEFKENTRAYDKIIFNINKEKFDKFEKEYGVEPFNVSGVTGYSAVLINGVIEFKEKAIRIKETGYESKIIPYYFIDKVTGIYYIKCED